MSTACTVINQQAVVATLARDLFVNWWRCAYSGRSYLYGTSARTSWWHVLATSDRGAPVHGERWASGGIGQSRSSVQTGSYAFVEDSLCKHSAV